MNKDKRQNNSFIQKVFGSMLSGVSTQDKVNFSRNLSVGIKSGMSLIDVLKLLTKQSSKEFVKILKKMIDDINNGQLLAQSLSQFNHVFGDFFISIVRVGESSGNLSSSLMYLAKELKKQRDLSHKVKSAMIYPAILLFATIGIIIFLTLFVFPKILPIFQNMSVELPFTTRSILWLLDFIKSYWIYIIGGIVSFIILAKVLLISPKIKLVFHRFVLKIPYTSNITKQLALANFTRTLNILLKSGMTLTDALNIVRDTFSNYYYRLQIDLMNEHVQRGGAISRYLESRPDLFPPMFTGMIHVGESTGNLEENLLYLSEYYESEVDERLKGLTAVIEPAMLLFMGVTVGYIALSIITPIYKVTQGVSQ